MTIVADYEPGTIDQYIAKWKQKGYDIDDISIAPGTEGCPFRLDIYAYKEGSRDYNYVMSLQEGIVDIMNAEVVCIHICNLYSFPQIFMFFLMLIKIQIHKEKYEVKELVTRVHSWDDLPLDEEIQVLKFNVSEVHTNEVKTVEAALYDDGYSRYFDLKEWRFKVGSPETPPEIPYPRSPSPEPPRQEGPSIPMHYHLFKRDPHEFYPTCSMV
ncbi:uncharacterized protein LOC131000352 isoform X1 [Salvia miltiorrhiza]|uniref:uncharacterized protein LOC131000352 isoform X1 n=1 Tax=Salvia miltiorrhiza TaxID=226208 RepID=UPI0025AD045E|nr:uncharacterized protein LOC131000352 isoform X1 [Salvia miltiorrhiza]